MAAIDDKITKLETQLKQAKAQRQKVEARKRAATSKMTRQQDTRKKILVGAAILAKVERGEWPKEKLLAMLETTLTRADDRALVDLQARFSGRRRPRHGGHSEARHPAPLMTQQQPPNCYRSRPADDGGLYLLMPRDEHLCPPLPAPVPVVLELPAAECGALPHAPHSPP